MHLRRLRRQLVPTTARRPGCICGAVSVHIAISNISKFALESGRHREKSRSRPVCPSAPQPHRSAAYLPCQVPAPALKPILSPWRPPGTRYLACEIRIVLCIARCLHDDVRFAAMLVAKECAILDRQAIWTPLLSSSVYIVWAMAKEPRAGVGSIRPPFGVGRAPEGEGERGEGND
ncbi:hypothetical protein F4803DRAFT_54838 [Xylaria telfairii]|nr:hypothetical protein F4803DRAFT_54838 [Xylaria telfairii]